MRIDDLSIDYGGVGRVHGTIAVMSAAEAVL
jgi:hypothetical protein